MWCPNGCMCPRYITGTHLGVGDTVWFVPSGTPCLPPGEDTTARKTAMVTTVEESPVAQTSDAVASDVSGPHETFCDTFTSRFFHPSAETVEGCKGICLRAGGRCNAFAVGSNGCVTFRGCVASSEVQAWGWDFYFVAEATDARRRSTRDHPLGCKTKHFAVSLSSAAMFMSVPLTSRSLIDEALMGRLSEQLHNVVLADPVTACEEIKRPMANGGVLIVQDGGCPTWTKAMHAQRAGADAVLVLQNEVDDGATEPGAPTTRCSTVDDSPCKFPFMHKNETFAACTTRFRPGPAWCATDTYATAGKLLVGTRLCEFLTPAAQSTCAHGLRFPA